MCRYMGNCRDYYSNDPFEHRKKYSHPPRCPKGAKCEDRYDDEHSTNFIHPMPCRYGDKCFDTSAEHLDKYTHAFDCTYKGNCTEDIKGHLAGHPKYCKEGEKCKNDSDQHNSDFRHPKTPCPNGFRCNRTKAVNHMKFYSHPFLPPCKEFQYCKSGDDPNHMRLYSHYCRHGIQCLYFNSSNNNNNSREVEKHNLRYLHPEKPFCADDRKCIKWNDGGHMEDFAHTGVRDFRVLCTYGSKCLSRKKHHFKRYSHPEKMDGLSFVQELNNEVDFRDNARFVLQSIMDYTEGKLEIPADLTDWLKKLHFSHRCRLPIFQSIIHHGVAFSRKFQDYISQQPLEAAHCVLKSSPAFRNYLNSENLDWNHQVSEYVKIALLIYQAKHIDPANKRLCIQPICAKTVERYKELLVELKIENDDNMNKRIFYTARAIFDIHAKHTGIGYSKDLVIGTNNHIFSIMGPHNDFPRYGGILLIFSRKVMFHPDCYITPHAGTGYFQNSVFDPYIIRPWTIKSVKNDKKRHNNNNSEDNGLPSEPPSGTSGLGSLIYGKKNKEVEVDSRLNLYIKNKLNPASGEGFYIGLAAELVARYKKAFPKAENFGAKEIQEWWMKEDSHSVFEGHMSGLLSLDYLEKVVIKQEDWDALPEDDKNLLNDHFRKKRTKDTKDWLILQDSTDYNVIINQSVYSDPVDEIPLTGFCVAFASRQGREFYLPMPFEIPGKGKVSFEVIGKEKMIVFSNNNINSRGKKEEELGDQKVIVVWIGKTAGWIARANYDGVEKEVEKKDLLTKSCNHLDGKRMKWIIEYDADVGVTVAHDEGDGRKFSMVWTASNLPKDIKYVSISAGASEVTFLNVCIH